MKQFIHLQRDSQPGEATPLAGKSAEEILQSKLREVPSYRLPSELVKVVVIEAMEEYASQFKDNGLREDYESLIESVQHLLDMRSKKASKHVMNNAWNILEKEYQQSKKTLPTSNL